MLGLSILEIGLASTKSKNDSHIYWPSWWNNSIVKNPLAYLRYGCLYYAINFLSKFVDVGCYT